MAVHQQRSVFMRLGIVHRRPRSAVDHNIWAAGTHGRMDGGLVSYVEFPMSEADYAFVVPSQGGDEFPA